MNFYRVTFERLRLGRTERATMGSKCALESHARNACRHKAGFVRVISVDAITALAYVREFPENKRPNRTAPGAYQVQLRNQAA